MKLIDIPESFPFPHKDREAKPFTFSEYLCAALDGYLPYGKWDKMDRAVIVRGAIREMNGTLELDDADYKDVLEAVKGFTYNPMLGHLLGPFKQALLKPQKVKTATKK